MIDIPSKIEKTRMAWIDWMKVIGMYFIVVGHIFPEGKEYVYAFSVPLFFAISGFLCHKEQDLKVFWKKLLYNLIIPMLLFTLITYVWRQLPNIILGRFDINTLWLLPVNVLIGNGGQGFEGVGLIAMWFVYTLCILKIVLQLVPQKYENIVFFLIVIFCIAGNVVLNDSGIVVYNAWPNSLMAFPFFILGYLVRQHKDNLNTTTINWKYILPCAVSLIVLYLCGKHNGIVYMYKASYGGNYLLYLLGAFAGLFLVYVISKMLQRLDLKCVRLMGGYNSYFRSSSNFNQYIGLRWFY